MVIITKLLNRYVYTTETNSLIPSLRGMPMMIMMSFYIRQRIHGQTRVSSIRISIQNRTRVPLLVVLGLVIFIFLLRFCAIFDFWNAALVWRRNSVNLIGLFVFSRWFCGLLIGARYRWFCGLQFVTLILVQIAVTQRREYEVDCLSVDVRHVICVAISKSNFHSFQKRFFDFLEGERRKDW